MGDVYSDDSRTFRITDSIMVSLDSEGGNGITRVSALYNNA